MSGKTGSYHSRKIMSGHSLVIDMVLASLELSLLAKFDQEFLILGDSRLKKIPGWKFFEIYSTENTPGIHRKYTGN